MEEDEGAAGSRYRPKLVPGRAVTVESSAIGNEECVLTVVPGVMVAELSLAVPLSLLRRSVDPVFVLTLPLLLEAYGTSFGLPPIIVEVADRSDSG